MKTMKLTLGLLTMLALVASVNAQTTNQALLLDAGTGTPIAYQSFTMGYNFNVNVNTQVFAFGVWDGTNNLTGEGADGLLASHEVGLWTYDPASPTPVHLIADVTVPAGTNGTLIGTFRYVALPSPLSLPILSGSAQYIIGALYLADNADPIRDDRASGFPSVNSLITVIDARYSVGNSLTVPGVNSPDGTAFAGPNLLFAPLVPEPGIASLFVYGIAALWWRRNR